MKKKLVLLIMMISILPLNIIGFAEKLDINNYYLTDIVDDDADYLYLMMNKSQGEWEQRFVKVKKDLTGEFESVTSEKEKELRAVLNQNDYVEPVYDDITVKDGFIFTKDGQKIIDITKYQAMNDAFYNENTSYERKPIDVKMQTFPVDDGTFIAEISINPSPDVPSNFNTIYRRYFRLKNNRFELLNTKDSFELDDAIVNSDGSYFLVGSSRIYNDNLYTAYHCAVDGTVTDLRDLICAPAAGDDSSDSDYNNRVNVIGKRGDQLFMIYLKRESLPFDDGVSEEPINFRSELSVSYYKISSSLKKEEILKGNADVYEDYLNLDDKEFYLDKEGAIYYLCDYGEILVNAQDSKAKLFSESVPFNDNQSGSVIGTFTKSDTEYSVVVGEGTKKMPIPTYEMNGQHYFIAEDLTKYGYALDWDSNSRVTHLKEDWLDYSGLSKHYKDSGKVYASDVHVLIKGQIVKGYNIGGYTLVNIDDSNLYLEFVKSSNVAVGTVMGNVLYSDIKTYFNGERVNGYNVDGHIAISIRDMRGRDYDVLFDDKAKRVDIFKSDIPDKEWATEILADKPNLSVGDTIGHILSTDIEVVVEESRVPSYNYDGYMVIMAKDLSNFGFDVVYTEDNRTLSINTTK